MNTKNVTKKFKAFTMLFTSALVLSACGGDTAGEGAATESTATSTDTLFIGMTNAPDSFNPFNAPGVAGKWVQRYFYDSLLTMPTTSEFGPGIADSFETEDNQNFTLQINEDAVWTDGTPITADDVVFTLNMIADPEVETTEGQNVSMLEGVSDIGKLEEGLTEIPNLVAVDDKTVTLRTEVPVDPAFIKEVLGFETLIVPKHIVESIPKTDLSNSEFATNPSVFSGPYTFEEYQNNAHVELAANPDYYKGEPELQTIFIRVMNGTNLVTEFQSNGIQMAAGGGIGMVPVQDIEILENDENIQVDENPGTSGQFMLINNERFSDPTVRQAFAHAINRDQIVDSLLRGRGEVLTGPYTSVSEYKNEDLDPLAYDPELAQQLLEESGFDTSQEINLVVPIGNKVREQSASLIEQDLEAIGLNVVQTTYDFPTALDTARNGEYDLVLMGYGFIIDPDVSNYFHSEGSSNYSRISNPELDAMFAEGQQLTSFEERKEVYDEIQAFMQEEVFTLPLYSDSQFGVKSTELEGGIKEYWAGSLYDAFQWNLGGVQ